MLERRWGPLGALEGAGGRKWVQITHRDPEQGCSGQKGLDLQPRGGFGWFGCLCGARRPPTAQAPTLAWVLVSESRKGSPSSPVGCFHSLQREDEGAPAGVLVLLLFPGRPPE